MVHRKDICFCFICRKCFTVKLQSSHWFLVDREVEPHLLMLRLLRLTYRQLSHSQEWVKLYLFLKMQSQYYDPSPVVPLTVYRTYCAFDCEFSSNMWMTKPKREECNLLCKLKLQCELIVPVSPAWNARQRGPPNDAASKYGSCPRINACSRTRPGTSASGTTRWPSNYTKTSINC